MIKEAGRYAEEDKKRRAAAEKLNETDGLCYEAEKMLAEFSNQLTDEVKRKLEKALQEGREAVAKKDPELAGQRAETLKKVLKEAGAILYAQTPGAYKSRPAAQPAPEVGEPGAAHPSGSGPHGRVVDAEYREASK